jgi:hypothetical protein
MRQKVAEEELERKKREEAAASLLLHKHAKLDLLVEDAKQQMKLTKSKTGINHLRTTIHSLGLLKAGLDVAANKQGEEENSGPKREASKDIQGILIYLAFIAIYICSTVNYFDPMVFFFSNSLKSQFLGVEMQERFSPTFAKTFDDVATVEELYHWFQSGFTHSAFSPNTFDSSDRIAGMLPGYTLGANKIVGAIRVSQTRVKRGVCGSIPAELGESGHAFQCWEDTEPMEPFGNFSFDGIHHQFERAGIKLYPEYETLPAEILAKERVGSYSSYISKRLEIPYDSPAWAVLLDPTAPIATNEAAILALVNGKYVDLQTTAVFVDFTVYNPSLDYMSVVKLVAELPPGGGVYTSSEFHVVRLYNRYTDEDKRIFVLNALVGVFYLYYFMVEMRQLFKSKSVSQTLGYLKSPTNVLIIANIVLYMAGIYCTRQVYSLSPAPLADNTDGSTFQNYWPAAQSARLVIQLASANCFLNFFQGVEHLAYVPTFALLGDTLKVAGPQLLSFSFVFAVIGYGFIQAHTMVFRDRIEGYRNFTHSMYSLMSSLLGDIALSELYDADHLFGPFFFVFFVVMAVFVVLNMVIAIISDAYSVCASKMRNKPKVNILGEVTDYFLDVADSMPFIGPMFEKHRNQVKEQLAKSLEQVKKAAEEAAEKARNVAATTAAGAAKIVPLKTRRSPRMYARGLNLGPTVSELNLSRSLLLKKQESCGSKKDGEGAMVVQLSLEEQDPEKFVQNHAQVLARERAKGEKQAHSVAQMLVSEMEEMKDGEIEMLLERQEARMRHTKEQIESQRAALDVLVAMRALQKRKR